METYWRKGQRFEEFVGSAEKHRELWHKLYERACVPDAVVDRVEAVGGHWRFLVLAESWCGDAINTLPLLQRLADRAANLELRIVRRDENPELMDAHLTDGSRSIPIVMILDDEFVERGAWGPRPEELQQWVMEEGMALGKTERYRHVRRWYARDGGATILGEVVQRLEESARTALS